MNEEKKYLNQTRDDYRYILKIPTRWMDNDVYHHVNNVIYYSYFDTAVNEYLIRNNVLNYEEGKVIGLVIETSCSYLKPIKFPDTIDAAIRVAHLGNSSVRYEIGLFNSLDSSPSALGYFVHVYVNRSDRKPVTLPVNLRSALEKILVK